MMPPLQATRLDRALRGSSAAALGAFRGSWRRRSLLVLALLVGFYAGENVTAFWLAEAGQRPVVVLLLVLLLELLVRLRTRLAPPQLPLAWLLLDNLRIGLVFAVVLEAFKLGS